MTQTSPIEAFTTYTARAAGSSLVRRPPGGDRGAALHGSARDAFQGAHKTYN
ncbi:hypothetical protein [Nostoc sp.]|uniref:hypothetical protein n=1 Tax=Nostoc sp. TaxID=1180 RepID=UPI002FF545D2